MPNARRLAALLCLAAVLYTALAPGAPSLPWAILIPVWFFFAALAAFAICREARSTDPRPSPFVSLVASRAPPIPQV